MEHVLQAGYETLRSDFHANVAGAIVYVQALLLAMQVQD
jgi:hypothetical protein